MDEYTVTIGQLVLSSPQDVYRQIRTTLTQNPAADLFVFPEFATQHHVNLDEIPYLQGDPHAKKTAQNWLELIPESSQVKALFAEANKAVLFGSLAQDDSQLTSRAYFYDPQEQQLAVYDKSHVHWTETFLRPGTKIEAIPTRFGVIGILICYDMAFSEAARVLGIQGVQVLYALSAIPLHFSWKVPHRRMIGGAIFNQFYAVAANLGWSPRAPMGGYSGIYSPKGDLIKRVKGTEYGHISAQIDLQQVKAWREEEMINPYRKPHLYQALTAPAGES